jgi:hypothetical protein
LKIPLLIKTMFYVTLVMRLQWLPRGFSTSYPTSPIISNDVAKDDWLSIQQLHSATCFLPVVNSQCPWLS